MAALRKPAPKHLYITGVSVGNGADLTEDTLQTFNIPAGVLQNVGDRLRIVAGGTAGATTDSKAIRIKLGGTTVAAVTVSTAGASQWRGEVDIVKTAANVQSVCSTIGGNNGSPAMSSLAPTLTDTAAIALLVTGQNTTSSVAGSITCRYLSVEFIPAP